MQFLFLLALMILTRLLVDFLPIVLTTSFVEFKFTLFRCRLRSGLKNWYLSQMHPSQPGTEKDIDYYLVKSKSVLPPTELKWETTGVYELIPKYGSYAHGTGEGQNAPPNITTSNIPIGVFREAETSLSIFDDSDSTTTEQ